MPHTHSIDGKLLTFPDDTCPICHPELVKQPKPETPKAPTVYRKGNTVVLKLSRFSIATLTYWTEKDLYLLSITKVLRDANGKIVRDNEGNLMWNKATLRLNRTLLKDWITQLSSFLTDTTQNTNIPQRQ
ncbi:MAG: hypothetical protein DRO23_09795 [Thermoprotei archaeon]|nr:MAG: hypothetical protein DRO23_09795 [Thermoprotei archaeon]